MDEVQQQFERGVAERFFEWLLQQGGPNYSFVRRSFEAPDLVYRNDDVDLGVEITAAYYDRHHAEFLWKNGRGIDNSPVGWHGEGNPHKALAEAIIGRVIDKCKKRYGVKTLLLVEVPPGLTSAEELIELLPRSVFPQVIPFVGAYVVGRFPITCDSFGDYHVLPIKNLPGS